MTMGGARTWVCVAAAAASLAACSSSKAPAAQSPTAPSSPAAPPAPAPPTELLPSARAPLPDGHPDLPSLQIASRGARRLSVEQLEQSLDRIASVPAGTVRLPDNLALALGRPDYLRVTNESLEPSPLFMKFMMDFGGFLCRQLSDGDPQRPAAQRVLTRFADDADANHRALLLRFTGIEGAAAEAYLPRLRAAYARGAQASRGAAAGWEAVCLALFTSPEFLLY